MTKQISKFEKDNKLLEAQRIKQRTMFDLEMLTELGVCSGIENYSRYFDGRKPGEAPYTLIDFFPKDFLMVVDESHIAIPQIRGQYEGDKSRKSTLVDYGFRLPAALDNRPLKFDEWKNKVNSTVLVSATPGKWENENSEIFIEQIIRPTGLLDPNIFVRPTKNQIEDLFYVAAGDYFGGMSFIGTMTSGNAIFRFNPDKKDYSDQSPYVRAVSYTHLTLPTKA